MNNNEIDITVKDFLDEAYRKFAKSEFIETDPVQIPHLFSRREDVEISAFLTAVIAWGQRDMIIKNARKLIKIMENSPYEFIMDATVDEIVHIERFVHRTFMRDDLVFFLLSLSNIYKNHGGLKGVFYEGFRADGSVFDAIKYLRKIFLSVEHAPRSEKHVADVTKGAAAKRINMFLRWMVRSTKEGVDFNLWNNIPSSSLYLPLDLHTGNVSRKLGLLTRKQDDWKAVEEITAKLRSYDPEDPVKYDYALFGLGIFDKF